MVTNFRIIYTISYILYNFSKIYIKFCIFNVHNFSKTIYTIFYIQNIQSSVYSIYTVLRLLFFVRLLCLRNGVLACRLFLTWTRR